MYDGRFPELESVEKIKTEAVSSSVLRTTDKSAYGKHPSTASTISIADFLPLVNREFEKYPPKADENPGKTRKSADATPRETDYSAPKRNFTPADDSIITHSGESVNTAAWKIQVKPKNPRRFPAQHKSAVLRR